MIQLFRRFLDHLAARLMPLVAGSVATRIESAQALVLAQQQAELEEAARHYESQGLPEVAAGLRRRLARLSDEQPAQLGVQLVENVCGPDPHQASALATRLLDHDEPTPKATSSRRRKVVPASEDHEELSFG